jgi:hypothetical protein
MRSGRVQDKKEKEKRFEGIHLLISQTIYLECTERKTNSSIKKRSSNRYVQSGSRCQGASLVLQFFFVVKEEQTSSSSLQIFAQSINTRPVKK